MKRKIIVLLMVCAMLTACSGQTAPTAAPASEPGSSGSSSEAVSAPESSEPTASTIERIDLASDEFSGLVGDSFEVSPSVYPETAEAVSLTFSSTDESIATVDDKGAGVLVGAGSAEVIVKDTNSGIEARMTIGAAQQPSQPPAASSQQGGGQSIPDGPPERIDSTKLSPEEQERLKQHQIDQAHDMDYWDSTGIDWSGLSQDCFNPDGSDGAVSTNGGTGGAIVDNSHTREELREMEQET